MREIGILGGSFDPIHYGHIGIAESAIEECGLSKVILLPARVSPFKVGKKRASETDRVNMVKLIEGWNDDFIVSTQEADAKGISYTFNTWRLFEEQYAGDRLSFILGTDSFLELEAWYRGEDLLKEANFIVGIRPGYKESETEQAVKHYCDTYGTSIKLLNNPVMDISSTHIRECIKRGDDISRFVPQCIEEYIYENGLYK